jgi:hypothetical protein
MVGGEVKLQCHKSRKRQRQPFLYLRKWCKSDDAASTQEATSQALPVPLCQLFMGGNMGLVISTGRVWHDAGACSDGFFPLTSVDDALRFSFCTGPRLCCQ